MKAKVFCQGHECGQTICLIVNPRNDNVLSLVVEEGTAPFHQVIVPIKFVDQTTEKSISLSCSQDEFHNMDEFIKHNFIPSEKTYGVYNKKLKIYIPYTTISEDYVDIIRERVPKGGITLHPNTFIEAIDGEIGQLEEFLVDPLSERITHLVIETGSPKNREEYAVPASKINRIENDVVYLNISKSQIETFPPADRFAEKNFQM